MLLLTFLSNGYNQLNDRRDRQLDSIVTNIKKSTLKNLDSVHLYLDRLGKTNREKVFMFYGLIAIHYSYDYKRMRENKNTIEYSPYYIAYKRKGVCRDFAILFKELCNHSNIPCIYAEGKIKLGLMRILGDLIHFTWPNSSHAWNIVKYENKWHLMDATWSKVDSTGKYYSYDNEGNKKLLATIKRPNRKYYNASSNMFYHNRKPAHPAYTNSDTVYTYKSLYRKKKKILFSTYNFSSTLDSLYKNDLYRFTPHFIEECSYSNYQLNNEYWIKRTFNYLNLKRSKYDKVDLTSCKNQLLYLEKFENYLQNFTNYNYTVDYHQQKIAIGNYMYKLKRRKSASY